jgi:hypothetical protein
VVRSHLWHGQAWAERYDWPLYQGPTSVGPKSRPQRIFSFFLAATARLKPCPGTNRRGVIPRSRGRRGICLSFRRIRQALYQGPTSVGPKSRPQRIFSFFLATTARLKPCPGTLVEAFDPWHKRLARVHGQDGRASASESARRAGKAIFPALAAHLLRSGGRRRTAPAFVRKRPSTDRTSPRKWTRWWWLWKYSPCSDRRSAGC